jgi:hypothetical protein
MVGNLQGDAGRTLNISLSEDKAGVFHDFATDERGDFVTAVMMSRNLDFVTAALEIGKAAGIDVTMEHQSSRPQQQPSGGPRYTTSASIKPPDWNRDYKLSQTDIGELASWRGYSVEFCSWANTHCLIGRRKGRQWAFPVCHNGKIVSAHVRYDKNDWQYKPRLQDIGLTLIPLIIGDLANAEKIFFGESQWDGYALIDKLGIQYGERIALVCTRGSSIDDLLGLIPISDVILRDDLYTKTRGLFRREDVQDLLAQLLREAKIFIHKIPGRTRPFTGYSQSRPAETGQGNDDDEINESDLEDDPR